MAGSQENTRRAHCVPLRTGALATSVEPGIVGTPRPDHKAAGQPPGLAPGHGSVEFGGRWGGSPQGISEQLLPSVPS